MWAAWRAEGCRALRWPLCLRCGHSSPWPAASVEDGPCRREPLPPASGLSPGSALASCLLHDGPVPPAQGPGCPRSVSALRAAFLGLRALRLLGIRPSAASHVPPLTPARPPWARGLLAVLSRSDRGPCSPRLHLEGSAQLASTAADVHGTLSLRAPSPLASGVCWEAEAPFEGSWRERPVAGNWRTSASVSE